MYYAHKRILLTGATGFLGQAIGEALKKEGADVIAFDGDIRDFPDFVDYIDHSLDYVFHFADPSSQILFNRQARYAAETTINSFLNVSRLCQDNGVRLIYPSTGLLSQGKTNQYARCKAVCEDIHLGSNLDALAIRIFATYGPGEQHKRDYASVPYLFARDMVAGKQPVVYGDGNQRRDFIFIEDVVKAVLVMAEECTEPIIDLGSGQANTFNQVIQMINEALFSGDTANYIKPIYVPAPANYVEETGANLDAMRKYFRPMVALDEGIKATVEHLKELEK